MSPWPAIAAANNAEWCETVCQTHGIEADANRWAWVSRTRAPPLYPDAVTLLPDLSIRDLLARVDLSPGCSIKDSFAVLDLTKYGFRMLFEAEWVVRPPVKPETRPAGPDWTVVQDVDGFVAWENAWRGGDGPSDVLRAELLGKQAITVLAAEAHDRIVAGAVVSRSQGVVGLSNFFAEAGTPDSWRGCLALVSSLFPGATLVGYESRDALEDLRTLGFDAVGPLRVWVQEG